MIKKHSDIVIKTVFGRIFKKHNVIEYKSPEDELSIDDLYKTIGYACMYKGYGNVVNEIESTEMTISLFRHSYPDKLMKHLETMGVEVESPYPGVYYISGIINIPLQIVVVGRLEEDECNALRILTTNAKESDVKRFISISQNAMIQADKHNIDAILQVSVSANDQLYEKIRRDSTMCEALRELMKDEIDKEVEKAVEKAERDTKIQTRYEDGMSIEEIATKTNVSVAIVNQVLKEKGMLEE